MSSFYIILSTTLLLIIWEAAKAGYVTPCAASDQLCIDNTANNIYQQFMTGIPEMGIEPHEPMFHPIINGNFSTLKYTFYNATITGMNKCKLSNVKFNPESLNVHVQLLCPKTMLESDYEGSGTFIIPVHGNGDCRIVTGRYNFDYDCSAKLVAGSDNKQHISIKSCKMLIECVDPIEFDANNLFHGNKELSDIFHDLLHSNWKDANEFIKDSVWKEHTKRLISVTNKYLKNVPLEDMKSSK